MPETTISRVDELRRQMPDAAKDLRLNLQSVLRAEKLSEAQTWSVAIASAYFLRDEQLASALAADAAESGVDAAYLDDAKAAAALMGMNGMYYRFRHLMGKDSYSQMPPRLRMQRMGSPATSKLDFELMAMGCAVLAGCEMCIKAHEAAIIKGGLTEDAVHEAARIAAVVHGASVAIGIGAA